MVCLAPVGRTYTHGRNTKTETSKNLGRPKPYQCTNSNHEHEFGSIFQTLNGLALGRCQGGFRIQISPEI